MYWNVFNSLCPPYLPLFLLVPQKLQIYTQKFKVPLINDNMIPGVKDENFEKKIIFFLTLLILQ